MSRAAEFDFAVRNGKPVRGNRVAVASLQACAEEHLFQVAESHLPGCTEKQESIMSIIRKLVMSTKFEIALVILWMMLIIGTIYFVENKAMLSKLIPLYIVVMIATLIIARRGRD